MSEPENGFGDHTQETLPTAARGDGPAPPVRRLGPLTVVPTLCTLGNLIAGFAAIHYASKPGDFIGPWGWSGLTFAAALLFLGMALDAVDGSLARLTRSHSDLGGQLDSLADVVTFGVAPAYMMLQLVGHYLKEAPGVTIIGPEADSALGKVLWAVAAVYLSCAALRLARFNLELGPGRVVEHKTFRGLPSPGAAGAVASLILLHQHLLVARFGSDVLVRGAAFGIPLVAILCALAMVSSIPYTHVTNRYLYGPKSFHYIARLVVLLVLAIWWFQETAAVVFTAYALSGPVQQALRWSRRRSSDRAHKAG
jgi:CDP-diacylglycerol--serine O-phosphatidyltransferase